MEINEPAEGAGTDQKSVCLEHSKYLIKRGSY